MHVPDMQISAYCIVSLYNCIYFLGWQVELKSGANRDPELDTNFASRTKHSCSYGRGLCMHQASEEAALSSCCSTQL